MAKRRSGDGPAVGSSEEAEERLYGAPLERFVSLRDELARELRAAGDAEGALAIAALRKPSVALWAVNQLARRASGEVDRLLAAGETLREAQATDPDAFREVLDVERRLVAALTDRAAALLEEGGHAASEANLERVRRTLQAASGASDEERERLRRGTLRQELEPTGFGRAFAALGLVEGGRSGATEGTKAGARPALRALGREADGAGLEKAKPRAAVGRTEDRAAATKAESTRRDRGAIGHPEDGAAATGAAPKRRARGTIGAVAQRPRRPERPSTAAAPDRRRGAATRAAGDAPAVQHGGRAAADATRRHRDDAAAARRAALLEAAEAAEQRVRSLRGELAAVARGLDLQRRHLERVEETLRAHHRALHDAERALEQARERVSRTARDRDQLREAVRGAEARAQDLRHAIATLEAEARARSEEAAPP